MRALVASTGIEPGALRAGQVGFTLAPRLNAAGRIADANDGLQLLLTDDAAEAATIAARLETLNRERQALDQRTVQDHVAAALRPALDKMQIAAVAGVQMDGQDLLVEYLAQ